MILSSRNLWWPSFEAVFQDTENYIVKRMTDADVVASFVPTKGIAVQAGGHVGIFPRQLSRQFGFVYTFEASPETAECLEKNIQYYPNILMAPVALGDCVGEVTIAERANGQSKVGNTGKTVRQVPIDKLALPRCDLIYLDIEGYELVALKGAVRTIHQFRPVIALEVWKDQQEAVQGWADLNNYRVAKRVHSDWILTP